MGEIYLPSTSQVLEVALSQRKDLFDVVGEEKVTDFIDKSLNRIALLEVVARNPKLFLPYNLEGDREIGAILTISGPGDYFNAFKEDRYKNKPWSAWLDRRRIDYSVGLARYLAKLYNRPLDNGPDLYYYGRPDEALAVSRALAMEDFYFPQPKLKIISEGIDNTVDQVERLSVIDFERLEGRDIGVVIHSAQALRFLHILNRFKALPSETRVRIFPLPLPRSSSPQYPTEEICGIIALAYYNNPPKADEEPFPCIPSLIVQ